MLTILAEAALRSLLLGSVVWLGLNLLRVRNPNAHMTSWVLVLIASLSMPILMHWTTVAVTVHAPSVLAPERSVPAEPWLPENNRAASTLEQVIAEIPSSHNPAINTNWWLIATVAYWLIAALLLARLILGLHLTWRLAGAATPIREDWAADRDVRVSSAISGPVTFGSTILVPPAFSNWDSAKRQAVLAHESAHVANRDFYILLLASLNRTLFWFSPFAWWQLVRLAELAEIISDDRAIEIVGDRVSYAELLLELVQGAPRRTAGLEMARACTVTKRIEIILAAATRPARLGWRKRFLILAAVAPAAIVSAGSIVYRTLPAAISVSDHTRNATAQSRLPQHVEFYSLGPAAVFAIFHEGDDLFGQVTGQHKLRLIAMPDGTYSYSAAAGEITFVTRDQQSSALKLRWYGHETRAVRIVETPREPATLSAAPLDRYAGWYSVATNRVLTISREGDRLFAKETGRPAFEITASSMDTFSGEGDDLIIFLRDDQANVNRALFLDPMSGPRIARRIDAAEARLAEEAFAQRLAEVSDHFAEQTPSPGSKEALLRGIEDLRRGTPNYDRMSPGLSAKVRRQAPELHAMFAALGAVESIFFRGVGPGGYDIYGVKFASGSAEFRLSLSPNGKASDVIFRADGNDEPGDVAACSREANLKPQADAIPVNLTLFNNSGDDIELYSLDQTGSRTSRGTIADNMSSSILTYVDSPWVIADRFGKCLEIVLPGRRTRYHIVESAGARDAPEHMISTRIAPQPDSEEGLRNYILALSQGQPDYDRMTPEVAAQTRQQLPYEQAILGKLGRLRALSFRGVSALGNDIYLVSFVNGTAEWRISLTKTGMIGRIALGPQY